MQWISAEAESPHINPPVFGTHGLVEFYPGDTNLIISVPHGGEMKPPFLPDREKKKSEKVDETAAVTESENKPLLSNSEHEKYDKWETRDDDTNFKISTAADIFTQEIAKIMAKEYCVITGKKPYLIMANLHRSKLDPNRPIQQAAQGNLLVELVYKEYHKFIASAKEELDGPGLVIDLHGQNHHQNSIEIGYLYKKSELNSSDFTATVPSVRSLLARSGLQAAELLLGERGLGAACERWGYQAVPSPRQPSPGRDRYYKGTRLQYKWQGSRCSCSFSI